MSTSFLLSGLIVLPLIDIIKNRRETIVTKVCLCAIMCIGLLQRQKAHSEQYNCFDPNLEFPPPIPYRSYHRVNYDPYPLYVDPLSTAQYLLYHPNASFIRFGDQEADMMMGLDGMYQVYNESIAQLLIEILQTNDDNLLLAVPDQFAGVGLMGIELQDHFYDRERHRQFFLKHIDTSRQYFAAQISSIGETTRGTHYRGVPKIYATLRKVWKGKDVVLLRGNNGQVYTADIYDTAKSQTILYAPRSDAWLVYEELKLQLLKQNPEALYILACGPVCKILAYDLFRAGRRALDLGHLAKDYDVTYGNRSSENFYYD